MREPIRVAHVVWRLGREGGVQVVVRSLAAALDATTVDLHVITARPAVEADHVEEVTATVHPVGWAGGPMRVVDRMRLMWSVARQLRAIRPDVVHLHSGTVWLGLLGPVVLPRTPFVLEVHDAPGSWRHGEWTDRIEGWWIAAVRGTIVCHSASVRADVVRHWGARSAEIVMFPLAVDVERFSPRAAADSATGWREAHGVGASSVVAMVVGRLSPTKRVDMVIDAVADARDRGSDVELVIVGVGELEARLRALAVRRGVAAQVHFVGSLPGVELVEAYRSVDLCCSASVYEGFGLTLLEAMACGVPTLAMDVGGVGDVVGDGTSGVLVRSGDVTEFAARLAALCADGALRRQMGVNARARVVEGFNAAVMSQRFTAVYRDARSSGRSRRARSRRAGVSS